MKLDDYVCLYISDADFNSNGILKWNLPQSYYSNSRGNICAVSLVDCYVRCNEQSGISIRWGNIAQNYFTTKNNDSHLGTLTYTGATTTAHYSYNSFSEPIKLLTSARPSAITLRIVESENDAIATSDYSDGGFFVLKFEYFDEQDVRQDYQASQYNYLKMG